MKSIRFVVLMVSLGVVTTSGTSYYAMDSEAGGICCDSQDECVDWGGKCCDFSSLGVEDCGPGYPGYCQEACWAPSDID